MVKIKIIGKDGYGWSIDQDRFYNEKAIKELNYKITPCFLKANIIYSVWYSHILNLRFLFLRLFKEKRKIALIITNDIEDNNKNIEQYKKFTDFWICANSKQKKYLLTQNIDKKNIFINPFYVDENIFKENTLSKKEIVKKLNINYELIKDKFLIGSFQRDSRGDNLTKSKWHKNPELLIEVLKKINTDNFVLILAGTRRHFIINECRKHKIPYIFVGNETYIDNLKDDLNINNLPSEKINLLYNLIDLYIVTSVSEGGPKAIIEASITNTAILSTPVGFAPDLLNEFSICNNSDDFLLKLNKLINDKRFFEYMRKWNYEKVSKINNFEAYKQRIKNIIDTITDDK